MAETRFIQVLLPLRLKWEPVYSCPFDGLTVGDRVKVEFGGKEYVGVVTDSDADKAASELNPGRIKPVLEYLDGLDRINRTELQFWREVSDYYLCTPGEVYKAAYPMGKVEEEEVKARIRIRLLERLARKEERIAKARREDTRERYIAERDALLKALPFDSAQGPGQGPVGEHVEPPALRQAQGPGQSQGPELSEAQTEAYSKIKESFKSGKTVLLNGVTGSGKTEIYIRLARETMATGKNVLFMVPEIALSRQLEERIRGFFPDELQVFHSAESSARRIEVASFIKQQPYIVLGTRSSVFLPHRDLGLVIVDEEHDSSYKQDNPAPRYNGRDTAIMLAKIFKANVVLGSATPSLESLYNCAAGRFVQVDLTKRFFDATDSDVEIIDTIAERKKNGMVGSFSRKLIDHIRKTIDDGGQVALLRERRAYSPVVQCEECGKIVKCKRCDVALSLHHRPDGSGKLVCHYCGKVYDYSAVCPECGGGLKPVGAGTQKIEEEAKALFPEARIARLDSDNRKQEADVIKAFSEGGIDILIGTRMVAKGFDFSGLSLVAVLQADSLLGQQDYRADEHALQMLGQFRGRCGRRNSKGLFVIQTSQPDHPVYKAVIEGSTASPASRFLSERKVFGYPPYSRITNVVLKDHNLARLDLMGRNLASAISASGLSGGVSTTGPYPPPVEMVAREHIRIIRVLFPKNKFLKADKELLSETVENFERTRKYAGHIFIDVDPV